MNTTVISADNFAFDPFALSLSGRTAVSQQTEARAQPSVTPVDLPPGSWERRFSRAIQALRRA